MSDAHNDDHDKLPANVKQVVDNPARISVRESVKGHGGWQKKRESVMFCAVGEGHGTLVWKGKDPSDEHLAGFASYVRDAVKSSRLPPPLACLDRPILTP